MKRSAIPFVAAAVIARPIAALAQGATDPRQFPYGYGPHMADGWSGMIFGPLIMILVFAITIAIVVLIVRWLGGPWHGTSWHRHHPPAGHTALDILRERFARGEIDRQEFEERRRLLSE